MIGRFYGSEILPNLTKTGSLTLQASSMNVQVKGLGVRTTGFLNLNMAVNGLNGLDTGAVAINNYYYVYVVISGVSVGLVASLSSSAPVGFLIYKKVGALNTNQITLTVDQTINFGEQPISSLYLSGQNGFASTNIRFARYSTLLSVIGKEISYTDSASLGARIQCGKDGIYNLNMAYTDTFATHQEFAVTINGDSFSGGSVGTILTSNPSNIFAASRTFDAASVIISLAGSAYIPENAYLRIHSEQPSSVAISNQGYLKVSKIGQDEIDWS